MMDRIDINAEELELTVLSHLVQHAETARRLVDAVGLEEASFTDQERGAAFRALVLEESDDSEVRLTRACKIMSALGDDKALDRFLGLAPSAAHAREAMFRLSDALAKRALAEGMADIRMREAAMTPEMMMGAVSKLGADVAERLEKRKEALLAVKLPGEGATAGAEEEPEAPPCGASEGLLDMPGFVNDLVDFEMRTAHRPNRVLSFAGALALLAHLSGRKFVGPHDTFPNLYVTVLAGSASGKDHPRGMNKLIAARYAGMSASVISNVASGQALEDALTRTPALLCQFDEFHTVLAELKNERPGNTSMEALWRMLLTLYTSSNKLHTTRVRSAGQNNKQTGGEDIYNPSFSVFATSIPELFYRELSERALTGGLFGRMLVFEAGRRGKENLEGAGLMGRELPYMLARSVEALAQMPPSANDKGPISPRRVEYAKGASDELSAIGADIEALYDAAEGDAMAQSVWGRSREMVGKLALLRAISRNVHDPVVTAASLSWAWRLVRTLQERMLGMAEDYAASDAQDAKVQGALRMVRAAGRKGIMRSEVVRAQRLSKEDMDKVEATLVDRDMITVEHPPTRNGKGTRYRIKTAAKKGRKA